MHFLLKIQKKKEQNKTRKGANPTEITLTYQVSKGSQQFRGEPTNLCTN